MKKRILLISLILIVVGVVLAIDLFAYSAVDEKPPFIEAEEVYYELLKEEYEDITSDWYKISDRYISKIYPNTKLSEFNKKIDNNLVVYNGKEVVEDGIIKSGMHVVVNDVKYYLVVNGDLNGDGIFNQIDLNRLLINYDKRDELNDIEIAVSDINEDGVFDKIDIDLAADYILDNKFEIKDVIKVGKPELLVESGTLNDNGWYRDSVTLNVKSTDDKTDKLKYEIKGSHSVLLTEIKDGDTIVLEEFGAYKVYLWAYASDGNRSLLASKVIGVDTSDKCVKYGIKTLSDCMLVNDGDYNNVDSAISGISAKTAFSFGAVAYFDYGLAAAADNDGTSFIYRGDVRDNFVEFAGYTWRIVRRNGDGSVRLIFNGKSTYDVGEDVFVANSEYNPSSRDFSYVGYKYGLDPELIVSTDTVQYNVIGANTTYYFADRLDCSDETKKCRLAGNKISGVWSQIYDEVLNGNDANGNVPYKYTCWETTEDAECGIASEIANKITNNSNVVATSAWVKYHAYITKPEPARNSEFDSSIKQIVDKWYEDNLLTTKDENGVNYSSYLVDDVFCNDRVIYTGTGTDLIANTLYEPYKRMSWKTTSLKCSTSADIFTVSKSNKNGNGELKYPIGLITVDEVSYAGGVGEFDNTSYWLHSGQNYWTMSPSGLNVMNVNVNVWYVHWSGKPSVVSPTYTMGVRPVINLSKDVTITSGNGTYGSPYTVTLNK